MNIEGYTVFFILALLTVPKAFAISRANRWHDNIKIQWRDLFWGLVIAAIPWFHILAFCIAFVTLLIYFIGKFRRPSWWRNNVFPLKFKLPKKKVSKEEWIKS